MRALRKDNSRPNQDGLSDEGNRYNVLDAIETLGNKSFEQILIPLLNLEDKRLTRDLVDALGEIGTSKSVDALKGLTRKLKREHRSLAKPIEKAIEKLESQ